MPLNPKHRNQWHFSQCVLSLTYSDRIPDGSEKDKRPSGIFWGSQFVMFYIICYLFLRIVYWGSVGQFALAHIPYSMVIKTVYDSDSSGAWFRFQGLPNFIFPTQIPVACDFDSVSNSDSNSINMWFNSNSIIPAQMAESTYNSLLVMSCLIYIINL